LYSLIIPDFNALKGPVRCTTGHVDFRAGKFIGGQFESRPDLHNSTGSRQRMPVFDSRNGTHRAQELSGLYYFLLVKERV
jgi:hypothetical protein